MIGRRRLFRVGLVWATALVVLPSCTSSRLDFFVDERVDITAPHESDHVENPVTIAWTVHDLELVPPGSRRPGVYLAIFDNRRVLRPGASLEALVDSSCLKTPGCADRSWFARRGIHFSGTTSITLDDLGEDQLHEVSIVVIDGETDRRLNEAIFHVEFYVDPPDGGSVLRTEDFG